MDTTARPFVPVQLAAAQDRVETLRRELRQAEQEVSRLQWQDSTKTIPPSSQKQQTRCTYCTGYHPSYAGIGGCTMKSICSICGGNHKAGKRGENHARVVRAQRRAAGSEVSSPPSSPAESAEQGGSIDNKDPVDPEPASCGRCSDDEPNIESEPDMQDAAAACVSEAAELSWIDVVRGKRGNDKRSSAGGKRTGGAPPPPPPRVDRPELDSAQRLRPGWSAYGYPAGQRPANKRVDKSAAESAAHHARPQDRHTGGRPPDFDPGDFPHRGKPGCSCCGDSTPSFLHFAQKAFDSLDGHPVDYGYRFVCVCDQCIEHKPAYKHMFTATRCLHAVADTRAQLALITAEAELQIALKQQQEFADRNYFDLCREADPTVVETDLAPSQHTILSTKYQKMAHTADLRAMACQFEVNKLNLHSTHTAKYLATQRTTDAHFARVREETAAGRARQAQRN